jgi:hypothetical protein
MFTVATAKLVRSARAARRIFTECEWLAGG